MQQGNASLIVSIMLVIIAITSLATYVIPNLGLGSTEYSYVSSNDSKHLTVVGHSSKSLNNSSITTNNIVYQEVVEVYSQMVAETYREDLFLNDILAVNNTSIDLEQINDTVRAFIESKGLKYLGLVDVLNNTSSNTLMIVAYATYNKSIKNLYSLLLTFNKDVIERNLNAYIVDLDENYTAINLRGPFNVSVVYIELNSTISNYTIPPPIVPIPIPAPIPVTEERSKASWYMTVVLPYSTIYHWVWWVRIKGYLFGAKHTLLRLVVQSLGGLLQ